MKEDLSSLNDGQNQVKSVIAVMSGKGGVGKSSVSAMLASSLAKQGFQVGVLDADITGPSIPKMFGVSGRAGMHESKFIPLSGDLGIKVMSLNLLLEDEEQPVIWRGPMIAGVVKQFWSDVAWGGLDYLVVDLPPGTGDVPLTVLQSIPLDGVVIVSSPQDLAVMVVKKAINMVRELETPILGLVENMSYLECPDCSKRIPVFGSSKVEEVSRITGIPVLGVLPLNPEISQLADQGKITDYRTGIFNDIPQKISALKEEQKMKSFKIAIPEDNGQVNQHFGQSTSFSVVSIANQKVVGMEGLLATGLAHQHEGLAGLLKENGIQTVVAGGIGAGMVEALEGSGIKVITGASGSIDAVANAYASGQLRSQRVLCNHEGCGGGHHDHGGGCSCN